MTRRSIISCGICLLAAVSLSIPAGGAEPGTTVDFASQIRPLLSQQCFECHSSNKQSSGFRLDSRAAALRGGDASDHDIVPGKSDQSELIKRLMSKDPNVMMPPKGDRLTPEQIELFRKWIDAGAAWPSAETAPVISSVPDKKITPEQRAYWAFQPVVKPQVPKVKKSQWVASPIDAFVLATLEQQGIDPAPPAAKQDLIRRVSYDLTGLPPSPEEIDAFVTDNSPNAYEQMIDRYLASPRYGERWGQHWLDVVRFAESEGFEYDTPVVGLWRYRDYVIKSFNEDRPYNQFLTEQLAGDEIDPNNQEMLVAAGFHRLGPVRKNKGNQDVASSRNEVLTDRTDIIGAAMLGVTMGCARCHDHKFDPILHKDYYRLQGFLAATDANDISLAPPEKEQEHRTLTRDMTRQISQLKRQLTSAKDEEKPAILTQIDKLEDSMPDPLPGINTVKNMPEPTAIHVLRRGEWDKKEAAVGMRAPSVMISDDTSELPLTTSNPRTELAKWMTDPKHPLTPRVMANRVWQFHFGKGIVKTPNDFGINGDKQPSHPELLNYLAAEFVANGWHIKPLHKMILMSSTYRQSSSNASTVGPAKDPDNRWLWRFDRRRLSAEEIRDSMLAASGKLNLKMGGDSVFIPVEPDLVNALYKPAQWAITRDKQEHYRRSVYLVAKRNLRLPSMEVFDQPTLGASCGRRETSTHAPQALELLNGHTSNELAVALAARLEIQAPHDPSGQVELAFRLATGRPPTAQEKQLGVEFIKQQPLSEFALAMFNLNSFLYVN